MDRLAGDGHAAGHGIAEPGPDVAKRAGDRARGHRRQRALEHLLLLLERNPHRNLEGQPRGSAGGGVVVIGRIGEGPAPAASGVPENVRVLASKDSPARPAGVEVSV